MEGIRIDFSTRKHKALGITTATSHMSRACLDAILAHHPTNFSEVRMLGESSKDTEEMYKNLEVNVSELNYKELASVDEALAGLELLVLVPPPVDDADEWGLRVLEGCVRQGVEFIVLLTVLSATTEHTVLGKQFERMRAELRTTGIPYVEVASNLLFENFLHCAHKIQAEGVLVSPLRPDARFAGIAAIDVGNCMAAIAANPNKHLRGRNGNMYALTGPGAISLKEDIVPAFTKSLGKPIQLVTITYEQCVEAMVQHGDWGGLTRACGMAELYRQVDAGNHSLTITTQDVLDITGRLPLSFAQWVEIHKKVFGGSEGPEFVPSSVKQVTTVRPEFVPSPVKQVSPLACAAAPTTPEQAPPRAA